MRPIAHSLSRPPSISSIAGNSPKLLTAPVSANGSLVLVQVSMKGRNQVASSSMVGRTLTKGAPASRVNSHVMQSGQKLCCSSGAFMPPITGSPLVTSKPSRGTIIVNE